MPYWGRWYVWEVCVFFGIIGAFFSIVGLFHAQHRKVLSVGGVVLVMVVLATGAYSPHFRFFYDHVPGFNMFRSNSKFNILAVIFLIFTRHGLDMLLHNGASTCCVQCFAADCLPAAWAVRCHTILLGGSI